MILRPNIVLPRTIRYCDLSDVADELFTRIQHAHESLAMFVLDGGRIEFATSMSPRCFDLTNQFPKRLIGTYNNRTVTEDIIDDLAEFLGVDIDGYRRKRG